MRLITSSKPQSIINIGQHTLLEFNGKKPNLWFRFWQRMLLGFTWEDIK